jgi:hypothetical protein
MEKKKITHKDYMSSSHWTKKSKTLLSDPDLVCPICKRKRWGVWKLGSKKKKKKPGTPKLLIRFGCHHVSYQNLATPEEDKDILTLCYSCHDLAHTLHRMSKISIIWKKVYDLFCKLSVWEYYEEKEYFVPIDFIVKEPKKKK